MFKINGKYSEAIVYTDNCEETAMAQLYELCNTKAFEGSKVRLMPDIHAGKGCVVGFTATLGEKVVPNIVGVDIGCGMLTIQLEEKEIDFEKLDAVIREYVPSGMAVHNKPTGALPRDFLKSLRCYDALKNVQRLENSIGTLGGGNHFIEVDKDEDGNLYLVIHTGSRNLGKQVAEHYQKLAIKECQNGNMEFKAKREQLINKLTAEQKTYEISAALKELDKEKEKVPNHLCYLEGNSREDYLHDMKICQQFAVINRLDIATTIIAKMKLHQVSAFETIHNYIEHETNMVRKGAISAKEGEKLLIPINMRDGCIVGIGKGNEEWNCSAPHGAGRLMSRGKAKDVIHMNDFKAAMDGIFTTSVSTATLDEAPQAYKPMSEIIENIKDTVEIEKIIKPIYNFKAS